MAPIATLRDSRSTARITGIPIFPLFINLLARRRTLSLQLLYAGDPALLNVYHVMAVNPARHPHVQARLARACSDFLTGAAGQTLIGDFRIDGERLFTPTAAR